MFISYNPIHASKTSTAKIKAAIRYLPLKACCMELMTKHPTVAVCNNPATARCRVAACEVLSTAVTSLLHAMFWRKCTYRNVSQQITRKLSQISMWFLHHNVCHSLKMLKSVKSQKKWNFCTYMVAAPPSRRLFQHAVSVSNILTGFLCITINFLLFRYALTPGIFWVFLLKPNCLFAFIFLMLCQLLYSVQYMLSEPNSVCLVSVLCNAFRLWRDGWNWLKHYWTSAAFRVERKNQTDRRTVGLLHLQIHLSFYTQDSIM